MTTMIIRLPNNGTLTRADRPGKNFVTLITFDRVLWELFSYHETEEEARSQFPCLATTDVVGVMIVPIEREEMP